MSTISGRVAVITGAGSGIGRALALELTRRGARLALSDIDEAGVAESARLTSELGCPDVIHGRLDVADRAAFLAYADEVAAHFGVVNQIYNNAGVAYARDVIDSDLEDYDHVLGINLFGVINGTKAFLPHLIASGDGHVVNTSSLAGLMGQPEMSHYVASKYAVRGFTETLRMEMLIAKAPVRVSVVHPGGVATSIASNAARHELDRKGGGTPEEQAFARKREVVFNKKLLRMPPAKAAQIIVDGVEKDRPRILVGHDATAMDLMVRIAPRRYQPLAARYFARIFGTA